MKLINKIFAATFAATFSLPILSETKKGFQDKDESLPTEKTLLAQNNNEDDSGSLIIASNSLRLSV